ncbi:MAG: 16S rRNA (adenine(1518)-N(6)/adenine(1519)-N(6))-dimethyltransferase RsmA [Lachnospiraceae bacterium]|nr:16S rRNA (adenine(1518)-N(6)/adenine(1519)-N(6))-dimethyltransferase RsmA [Lachnospiraceae bacterium]
MAYLGKPAYTIAVLQKYNFNFRKQYGQNFLIDEGVLEDIIDKSGITEDDCVLEIGPGIGTLTQYLAEKSRHVVAVEIDKALIPILADTLSDYDNVTVINDDILKVDITKLTEEYNSGRPIKVVANLPYYITTPIVMGLLEGDAPVKSITVMVQKEVADRMQCGPGTKDYGALSLAVGYYADANVILNVSPDCFMPQPKVGSSVIKLDIYEKPPVETKDPKYMFKVIRAGFNMRRKTLVNALLGGSLNLTREKIESALTEMNLSPTIRGEALTLTQFAELADILQEK